jgi:hypothetical protein
MLKVVDFEVMNQMDAGKLKEAFALHLRRAAQDCYDRAGDAHAKPTCVAKAIDTTWPEVNALEQRAHKLLRLAGGMTDADHREDLYDALAAAKMIAAVDAATPCCMLVLKDVVVDEPNRTVELHVVPSPAEEAAGLPPDPAAADTASERRSG